MNTMNTMTGGLGAGLGAGLGTGMGVGASPAANLMQLQYSLPNMISNALLGDMEMNPINKLLVNTLILTFVGMVIGGAGNILSGIKSNSSLLVNWLISLAKYLFAKTIPIQERVPMVSISYFNDFVSNSCQKEYIAWTHYIAHRVFNDLENKMGLTSIQTADKPGRGAQFQYLNVPPNDVTFKVVTLSKERFKKDTLLQGYDDSGTKDEDGYFGNINVYCQLKTELVTNAKAGIAKPANGGQAETSAPQYEIDKIVISLQGSENLPLLSDISYAVVKWYDFKMSNKATISTNGKNQMEFKSKREFDHVWFSQKSFFMNCYNEFMLGRDLYDKRGDPWTFNVLLYGPPGCGKSSLIKAMATDSIKKLRKCEIYIVNPRLIKTKDQFDSVFSASNPDRLIVVEDFDCSDWADIFKKREFYLDSDGNQKERKREPEPKNPMNSNGRDSRDTKDKDEMFTLSDALNTLDGLIERSGQRAVWTTNLPEPQKTLDPAFLRRFDCIVKLEHCTIDGIAYLLKRYYSVHGTSSISINPEKSVSTPDVSDSGILALSDSSSTDSESEFVDIDHLPEYLNGKFTPCRIRQFCKAHLDMSSCIQCILEEYKRLEEIEVQKKKEQDEAQKKKEQEEALQKKRVDETANNQTDEKDEKDSQSNSNSKSKSKSKNYEKVTEVQEVD